METPGHSSGGAPFSNASVRTSSRLLGLIEKAEEIQGIWTTALPPPEPAAEAPGGETDGEPDKHGHGKHGGHSLHGLIDKLL